MTPEQAIEFLQLEAEDGHQALRRLREVRELPAVRYSKSLRYRPEKLMEWLETQEV
ncbi:MAG: helix-turn-helix domain-containing protein [Planctomycetota bacterium]